MGDIIQYIMAVYRKDYSVNTSYPELSTVIVAAMMRLTDAQRLDVFSTFCKHCGSVNPRCYCMADC